MRAMLIDRFGPPEVFRRGELPVPQAGAGEVVLRVRASSVNPIDYKIRGHGGVLAPALPAVLHGDVAGEVVAAGAGAPFAPGERVFGCAGGVAGHGGALAEFMLADARLLAPMPQRLDFAQAAALPLVAITAWEGLHDRAALAAGERVLVVGGTGGVGHVAVQLARAAGAHVTATVGNAARGAIARRLGAHEVIERGAGEFDAVALQRSGGAGFALVFDAVGGPVLAQALRCAARGGRVATIQARATVDLTVMHMGALSLHAVFMVLPLLHGRGRERHGEILRAVAAMVDAGTLAPLLDARRFGFSEVAAAHAHLESGATVGKVVLENDL